MDLTLLDIALGTKIFLLFSFVIFIPLSAWGYYFSRSDQRRSEIERYMKILSIKERDLFEHKNPGRSLIVSVLFVTVLSICFWILILFGSDTKITDEYNYLFGNVKIVVLNAESIREVVEISEEIETDADKIKTYQSGALLTFNMAFLGAYLWGIQSIARRYSMNDLIPIAYYNIGVRMIFASMLALVIYHLSEVAPNILASMINIEASDNGGGPSSAHLIMPIFAFLIGMFPQRGLKWLTDKFSVFTQKNDPSVRNLPLEMIEGVTIYDHVRLQELGIDSCYDLANVDYIPCLFKTPYSPRVLINWILQAKLCVYFGEHVKDLREHGIHTVWQLNSYDVEDLKSLVKTTSLTEDTLMLVKNLISNDNEIERLVEAQNKLSRYWNKEDKNTVNAEAGENEHEKDD